MNQFFFDPPIIAHRGASAYAPENTLIAFTKAIQLGAKWIEFDVQLTRSDELVIFHDTTLQRTTNAQGKLKDYPFAYLQGLDAGKWFHADFSQERILSLHQALSFLADKNISINIELKSEKGKEAALVEAVLKATKTFSSKGFQIIYSSFCYKTLQYLRKANAHVAIGLLMDDFSTNWHVLASELNVIALHLNEQIVNPNLIKEVKTRHLMIICYTVNDPVRARNLFLLGIDAVFTDKPDIILAATTSDIMI